MNEDVIVLPANWSWISRSDLGIMQSWTLYQAAFHSPTQFVLMLTAHEAHELGDHVQAEWRLARYKDGIIRVIARFPAYYTPGAGAVPPITEAEQVLVEQGFWNPEEHSASTEEEQPLVQGVLQVVDETTGTTVIANNPVVSLALEPVVLHESPLPLVPPPSTGSSATEPPAASLVTELYKAPTGKRTRPARKAEGAEDDAGS